MMPFDLLPRPTPSPMPGQDVSSYVWWVAVVVALIVVGLIWVIRRRS